MADYLSDDEQLDRLRKWWTTNGVSIVVGVILAIAAVLGWRWYQDNQLVDAESASEAFENYLAASEDTREAALATLEGEHGQSAYRVFALLHEAHDAATGEAWETALGFLETAVAVADEPLLRDVSAYRMAKVLYQLDRVDEALAALGRIQTKGYDPVVAELTGDIELSRGNAAAARDAFEAALAAAGAQHPRRLIVEMKLNQVSGT